MKIINYILGIVAILALAFVAFLQVQQTDTGSNWSNIRLPQGQVLIGNSSGYAEENSAITNDAVTGVTFGFEELSIAATTSVGDLLLTAAQICDYAGEIDLASGIEAGNFTLTLPTATLLTADCLSDNGRITVWIDNNSGDTATVTAGTGGDLLEIEGDDLAIGTAHHARIEIQMIGSSAYRASVVEFQDGD